MLQIHSLAGVFMLYYQQYHQHRCPSLFTVSLSFRRSTVDRHEHSGEDLAGSCHPLDHKRLELNLVCLCLKLKSNFNSWGLFSDETCLRIYYTGESSIRHDLSFYSDLQYFLLCTQFLDRCTEAVGLPFAARRLYTADGKEVSSLSDLQRNDLVYVTCGEPWSDPQLSYSEQQRRAVLANLAADISHIRQYCALRDPSGIVNILRLLAFPLMGSIVA